MILIYIAHKKTKEKTLLKRYPNAQILDVTSQGEMPWRKLSPFYPHDNIPVPFSEKGEKAMSVEGIWQGLKIFESEGIDISKFKIENMKGIKRTVRKFGKPLGHQKGVNGKELLDYPTARKKIYLRTYAWVLDHLLQDVLSLLKKEAEKQDLVLLDYNTNEDIDDYKKSLSHAGLVRKYLIKKYPELDTLSFAPPKTETKSKAKKTTKKGTESNLSKKKQSAETQLNIFENQ